MLRLNDCLVSCLFTIFDNDQLILLTCAILPSITTTTMIPVSTYAVNQLCWGEAIFFQFLVLDFKVNVSSDCLKEMYFEVLESKMFNLKSNKGIRFKNVCDIFDKVFNFQNIRISEFHT